MSTLTPEQIAHIENGADWHEREEPQRVCFRCSSADDGSVQFELVEFVGGQHWVCGGCNGGSNEEASSDHVEV